MGTDTVSDAPKNDTRILVVDDVLVNRELASRMLAAYGYVVDTAEDGASSLALLASRSYGLVLLDIQMPDMDGFEVCRRIRADPSLATLPVVMLSATDKSDDILEQVKAVGATSFMMKPFTMDGLAQMVARSLQ